MTPAAWISLASLAGFIIVQSVLVAFAFGKLFQRVSSSDKTTVALEALTLSFVRMEVNVAHAVTTIDELKKEMSKQPARRRAAE